MEKKNAEKVQNPSRVQEMLKNKASHNDPNGSYTGVPLDPREKPVQDSDDL